MTSEAELIHEATILKSLELVAAAWETDAAIDVEDMIGHLEQLNLVATGERTFDQLQQTTQLNKGHVNN